RVAAAVRDGVGRGRGAARGVRGGDERTGRRDSRRRRDRRRVTNCRVWGPPVDTPMRQFTPTVVGNPRMSPTSGDTIALLKRVPVFSALAEEELARVAEVTVPRKFDAGEVVFREGDESNTCYIVRSGHVRAIREHQDGRSITLAQFGLGDIFGE